MFEVQVKQKWAGFSSVAAFSLFMTQADTITEKKTSTAIAWKGPVQGFHKNGNHSIAGSGGKPSLKEPCSYVIYQKKDSVEGQRPANRTQQGKGKGHYTPQPKSNEIMEH